MDFDLDEFADMLLFTGRPPGAPQWMNTGPPEHVWIGYNSTRHAAPLPEPPEWKVNALIWKLIRAGIDVRPKDLRGLQLPHWHGGRAAQPDEDPGAGSDQAYDSAREAATFHPPSPNRD